MTPKALAQLRRDVALARKHLDFLERCADAVPQMTGNSSILRATPDMIAVARAQVANMERLLADQEPQLPLFNA
jgi:hypothetical protein